MVEISTVTECDQHRVDAEWKELMGEDLMMKVIGSCKPGSNCTHVEPQDAVLVTFEGRIASDRFVLDGPLFQNAEGWLIVVGDSDVTPALEMGIRHMKVGETALIWSKSKFALGNGTRKTIPEKSKSNDGVGAVPPKSNVMYKATVTQRVLDTSRLNPYFTIQKALTKKKIANDIYQNEWCSSSKSNGDANCEHAMKRAIRLYTKAAKEMETLLDGTYFHHVEKDHPQRHESRQILLDSLNNIVAIQLRQKRFNQAKISAVEVLKIDPDNIKALLRSAKAALMDPASTMEEASAAIEAAESAIRSCEKNQSKNEKELRRLKIELKEKQADYKDKTKAMFGNKLRSKPIDLERDTETTNASIVKPPKGEESRKISILDNHNKKIAFQMLVPLILLILFKQLYV
mmetsp:Transcript_16366/g.37889  ORF Transcript_16366/g.37889 Transcript_16366/m.37889 type:complete len:402 (+) Transcript_16366:70-1275(+)